MHSIGRWATDFQNDWAARADWCVTDFADANHAPKVALAHDRDLSGKVGDAIVLDAGKSTDPDGDDLTYQWWQFGEAGTLPHPVVIDDATSAKATLQLPIEAKTGETVHLVCTVRDSGSPTLTRYARVIVTVK